MNFAAKINVVLLWAILPVVLTTYIIMYKFDLDVSQKWFVYFIGQSLQYFFLSTIVYVSFKGTRHAGMSTAILIYSFFKVLESVLNLHYKIGCFDIAFKLLLCGLAIFIIYDYYLKALPDDDEY